MPLAIAAWDTAARIAERNFCRRRYARFFDRQHGQCFHVVSASNNDVRQHRLAATITTIVRTNFIRARPTTTTTASSTRPTMCSGATQWPVAVPHGSGADGNGDGIVNQADYTLWRSHFGNPMWRRQRWRFVHCSSSRANELAFCSTIGACCIASLSSRFQRT